LIEARGTAPALGACDPEVSGDVVACDPAVIERWAAMTNMQAIDANVARRSPFGHPVVGDRGGDTRRRILGGTIEALADVGFDATHVELIAERAGCSRPAFYQYFESKHDVFWALAGQLGKEIVTLAGELGTVTPDADGVAHLRSWIGDFMALHVAWAPVFDSFQAASRDHLPQARRSSKVSVRTDAALLRAFGRPTDGRNDRLMGAMVVLLERSSHYSEKAPATIDRQPFVSALADLFHRVFYGPIDGVNVDRAGRARRKRSAIASLPGAAIEPLPPRQERTRQRLLEAGLLVLPARGYHDTRVDDIAEAAGLSHGTFYRYFENKDAFFQALTEGAAERAVELLDRLRIDGPEDELRQWATEWMHTYRADGGIISTWQEMRTNVELADFAGQVARAMFTRLVRVLDDREFGHPEADATSMLALLERLPNNVYTLGFTTEKVGIDAMVTILRRGYFALDT
jgi:AcrR family transcriptional regulator